MRRPVLKQDADNAPGQDSFLDILANIVGILIILVMVVGVRVKNAPVETEGPDKAVTAAMAGLADDRSAADLVRSDVLKVERRIQDIQSEAIRRDGQRVRLATAVAGIKKGIEEERQKLDAHSQKDFDLRRALTASQIELAQLYEQRNRVEHSEAETTIVKTYPTPLSRTVDNHEAHFQLREGLLVFVPMQELLDEFKADARTKAGNLARDPEMTATIAPIGGFRLKYTLYRKEMAYEPGRRGGVVGTFAALKHLSLIPTSNRMGETVDSALAEGSDFRRHLHRFQPGRSTVTIWTYPDSFEEFRRLKKELYQMGYETAGRPLPFGVPITASPEGSKSAAE